MLQAIKNFWNDEEGLGTLEILLIVGVLVAVAFLFRDMIWSWVDKLLNDVDKEVNNLENVKKK